MPQLPAASGNLHVVRSVVSPPDFACVNPEYQSRDNSLHSYRCGLCICSVWRAFDFRDIQLTIYLLKQTDAVPTIIAIGLK